ncbi:immunoglobulin domain-containing protein [Agromyces atrinae]|uniref:Ig-like domain-containing protein n=1 Tax=Agromyces atrinae TaxID=592376 RepID=A0A4Q2MC77_9MICO|nr:immunoglobulin domain-containing protein [Agromyces atrinae]NYD68232.1 hypothetical protein [Agromyces atrinae]RXZ87632.1 hypothetical protein ESP50_00025 [Agromyces atrinae]
MSLPSRGKRLLPSVALALAASLGLSGLAAAPAFAAETSIDDAVFRWGVNAESNARAFAPGTWNFLSAGVVPKESAADLVVESDWRQSDGAVSIEKRQADDTFAAATWLGLRTDKNGTTTTTGNGLNSGHEVVIGGGTGTIDPDAGTASISWTGSFSVVYYSGMTQFWVKNPHLEVAEDGTGTVTATLGGWGSSMEDPELFVTLDEAPGTVIAQLSDVVVDESGITVQPDYLGVVTDVEGQTAPGSPNHGSFPQSFVDFQKLTGQNSYWFSSGGAADARKVPTPITVAYDASAPEVIAPSITAPPQSTSVAEGEPATFAVTATGDEPLTYRWQRSVDGAEWADIDGADDAEYAITSTTASDTGASFRVIVSNPAGEVVSDAAVLTVIPTPTNPSEPIDGATIELGFNNVHQGASPFGGCNYFVAGAIQGLGADYTPVSGNTYVVKKLADGGRQVVGLDTRCSAAEGSDKIEQRYLLVDGQGEIAADGSISIQWTGAGATNAYGGLVSWYFENPTLTLDADGNGAITANIGGFGSSMENPNETHPLKPRVDVEIATVRGAKLVDGKLVIEPVYAGVDYFPLNADGTRSTTSAIPAEAKAANPAWGSWPTEFTDFQYETGLSSYWHTSGLTADPNKPPLPVEISLEGSAPAYGPVFVAAPTSVNLQEGADATFTARAISVDDVELQWQVKRAGGDWTDVAGETGETLAVTDLSVADWNGASVRASATSRGETVYSSAATVTVTAPTAPTITRQPTSATIGAGSSMSLRATATGYPAPTYQWERKQSDGSWSAIAGATTANYNAGRAAYPADNGATFRVVVTNSAGSVTSDEATYTVYVEAAKLTSSPKDAFSFVGGNAFFSVGVSGAPRPTASWERSTDGITWEPVTGGEGGVLSFSALTLDQSGAQYRATISNGLGDPITSESATLTVLPAQTPPIHVWPSENLDPSIAHTINFVFGEFDERAAQGKGLYRWGIIEKDVWQPGDAPVAVSEFVSGSNVSPGGWTYFQQGLYVGADLLKAGTEYGFAMFFVPNEGNPRLPQYDVFIPITLAEAPSIAGQPADVVAPTKPVSGDAVATFSVETEGRPAPSIAWEREVGGEWVAVDGATASTLDVAYTATDDGARFRAVVDNGIGDAVTSEVATLTVGERAEITAEPVAASVVVGETATFTAAAVGTDATLQWQSRANGASEWVDVAGETGPILEVDATRTNDGTAYRLVVTSPIPATVGGDTPSVATSAPAVLTVQYAAITFTEQPSSFIAPVAPANGSAEVVFEVAATGTPAITGIQWQRATGSSWVDIDGATDASFGFAYTATDDGARFRAVVENALGETATSHIATLTVGQPVAITAQPESTTVLDGASATFSITATGTDASIRWERRAAGSSAWVTVPGATSNEIVVAAAAANDGAAYRAVVSGPIGTDIRDAALAGGSSVTSAEVTLDVAHAASITAQPADVSAPVVPASGDPVARFTVGVAGDPAPSVQWQRAAVGGDFADIEGATAATLELAYGAEDDGTRVRAVVGNGFGDAVTSDEAVLTVGVPAAVTSAPASTTVTAGTTASFTIGVVGDDVAVQWEVAAPGSTDFAPVVGASGTTIEIGVADARHGQSYRAVVTGTIPALPGAAVESITTAAAGLSLTAPEGRPDALVDGEFGDGGEVSVVSHVGNTLVLDLGADYAAQYVGTWVHSTPQWLGWQLSSNDARATVTLPANLDAGTHSVVLVDALGDAIGWVSVDIAADGEITEVTPGSVLASTGVELGGGVAAALLLLLVGGFIFVSRRRSRIV